MEFIKCGREYFEAVVQKYAQGLKNLEETVNYPKWSEEHPSNEYIFDSISRGELFACVENERILGAAVLSENPEGAYELGDWKTQLSRGEYLVIHAPRAPKTSAQA